MLLFCFCFNVSFFLSFFLSSSSSSSSCFVFVSLFLSFILLLLLCSEGMGGGGGGWVGGRRVDCKLFWHRLAPFLPPFLCLGWGGGVSSPKQRIPVTQEETLHSPVHKTVASSAEGSGSNPGRIIPVT